MPHAVSSDGVHISEVPKFFSETPSETTHVLLLVNPFDTTHPLIILLPLSGVSSYFDMYFLIGAEYENDSKDSSHC